jgi:hypothetical protein
MDQLLSLYGEDRYNQTLDRITRFWRGEGRCLLSVVTWEAGYRQTFDDAVILERAPEHLRRMAELPGVQMPFLFADFGTISTAKYWGGTAHFDSTGGNIFIEPMAQEIDAALALRPKPVDDPALDGAHGVRLWKELSARLQTDHLWLRSPDMQGVLTTAGLIMNQEELLMAMYAEPEKVHPFLEQVCEFIISYANYLRRETSDRLCGNIWPYTFLPSTMGLSFTEDLMPLLSPELYAEFGIPQLKRLQAAFGGLHIHCCGDWGRHAANLANAGLNILAMEFHYPATRIEELTPLIEQNVVFIPFLMQDRQQDHAGTYDYWRWLLKKTDARFWFLPSNDEEGLAFYEEFKGLMPA